MPAQSKTRFSDYSVLIPLGCLFSLLLFSREAGDGVRDALTLCGHTILPALFPFMVFTDQMAGLLPSFDFPAALDRVTRKMFNVPAIGLLPFLIGALSGFPLGIKTIADLYQNDHVSAADARRLSLFCNNTGPAFVISGVGIGLLGNARLGLLLYLTMLFSALIVGSLFARLPDRALPLPPTRNAADDRTRGLFASIRRSCGQITILCGVIVLFSAVARVIALWIRNPELAALLYAFLEVGGASAAAAGLYAAAPRVSLLLMAAAISFGGLSVYMQSAVFFSAYGLPPRRYLTAKSLQAGLSVLLTLLWIG